LIMSWILEITPTGMVVDRSVGDLDTVATDNPKCRPVDNAIDCALLAIAALIGLQLVVTHLIPSTSAAKPNLQVIAVEQFRAASSADAEAMSRGLVTEIQHQLMHRSGIKVVVADDPYLKEHCLRLRGSISVDDSHVRVTAMVIENDSGTVVWSEVFRQSRSDELTDQVELARAIVSAMPGDTQKRVGSLEEQAGDGDET